MAPGQTTDRSTLRVSARLRSIKRSSFGHVALTPTSLPQQSLHLAVQNQQHIRSSSPDVVVASKRRRRQTTLMAAVCVGQEMPTMALALPPPSVCEKCGAKKFAYESDFFCCQGGGVVIATTEYPTALISLFTSLDDTSKLFRTYARLYNNAFAFSSLGGQIDAQTQKGIYVFKVHGQLYHFVPDLLPTDGQPRSLREIDIAEDTEIRIRTNPVLDPRVYNAPTSDEVAAIWPDTCSSSNSIGPYIVVHAKSTTSHRIKHYYGCYDPLQYPLLFPKGDSGWRPGIKKITPTGREDIISTSGPVHSEMIVDADQIIAEEEIASSQRHKKNDKHVSPREYYAYTLQIRPFNWILRTCRVLQQFIVDMYIKIENTRLDYFRNDQAGIRAELYQGLMDTYVSGENNACNAGHRIVLPASFIGGPRDMQKRYLNALCLVQRYGKPDLFLTMTCNPKWHEIVQELAEGEHAQNRPDLLARIFRAKLLSLKKLVIEEQFFGEVAALIYVIEFQKRGLPHAHMLVILKPDFKIKDPEFFDRYVCAEIPSAPYLRQVILNHMMHGPCGKDNPDCACMKHKSSPGKCKYGYPKQFTPTTTNHEDGYPQYRRRDSGETFTIRGIEMDNRWVIPYNPHLSALFDCHLNVEICSSIQAVKYLYKYVYKGHDRVSFSIAQIDQDRTIDEIEQYQSGRWVSPCEAAWRIFGFDLFEMHPPVLPLQVHLPNMQSVRFRDNERLSNILATDKRYRTSLTEFFKINATDPSIPRYLYSEFSEHFVWHADSKTWTKRKHKSKIVIGRLLFVSPSEGERYFLRLLLANVRGPTSFKDLRTVNGHVCSTFQEAALKLGLLEEDAAVEKTMEEASEAQMPRALRRLFATILIFCKPNNPLSMWEKYYRCLSDDFAHLHVNLPAKILRCTVNEVEEYLESMGRTLKEFGLDQLVTPDEDDLRRVRDIVDALDVTIPPEYIEFIDQLNTEQREAFNRIMEHIVHQRPGAFFVDGPGGTGKTFLYCALFAAVRLMGKVVLPTATSGIAAANIITGRTAHSRFKLPLDYSVSLTCNVSKQSSLAALIREASLIIWDEATMAAKENIESLDLLLRDLCDSSLLFGGKVIVFGGDFRQVLPVLPHKTQKEAIEASLVSSSFWPHFIKFRLSENVRARTDPQFSAFLLALGNGNLQKEAVEHIQLPTELVLPCNNYSANLSDLMAIVFPRLGSASFDSDTFTNKAILSPMNETVDKINASLIEEFVGERIVYKSFDSVVNDNNNIYPTEFLNTLCPGGMSPHELVLKKDCPVILLRNMAPSSGLCNGTRLVCKRFLNNVIECKIVTGHHAGEYVFLPRIDFLPPSSSKYPFQFVRKQFPIKLSFAMTINKSQGQTLDQVGVYLKKQCFSHGQLYVALSRARQAVKVKVLTSNTSHNQPPGTARNVVAFEVLQKAGII